MVPAFQTEQATMSVLQDLIFFLFHSSSCRLWTSWLWEYTNYNCLNHPDDLFQSRYVTPGFKRFSYDYFKGNIQNKKKKTARKFRFISKLPWYNNYYCKVVILIALLCWFSGTKNTKSHNISYHQIIIIITTIIIIIIIIMIKILLL